LLKAQRNRINSGFDPELAALGMTIAGYHIESGVRSFTKYSKAMISDLGPGIRPYLRSFYESVRYRYCPGIDNGGMDSAADLDIYEKIAGLDYAQSEATGTDI
jgi:hypothetical protein